MAKKSTITSILVDNSARFSAVFFRVGDQPLRNDGETTELPIVEGIKYSRHAFGQGAQVNQPCYAISFEGGLEKLIIPDNKFAQVTVAISNDEDTATPAMPTD